MCNYDKFVVYIRERELGSLRLVFDSVRLYNDNMGSIDLFLNASC